MGPAGTFGSTRPFLPCARIKEIGAIPDLNAGRQGGSWAAARLPGGYGTDPVRYEARHGTCTMRINSSAHGMRSARSPAAEWSWQVMRWVRHSASEDDDDPVRHSGDCCPLGATVEMVHRRGEMANEVAVVKTHVETDHWEVRS